MQVVLLPLSLSLPLLLPLLILRRAGETSSRTKTTGQSTKLDSGRSFTPSSDLQPAAVLARSLTRLLAYSLLSFSARVPGWPGRLVARPGMRYPRCHGPIRTHASGQSVIHNANARGFCPRLALGDQEASKRRRETAAATWQPHSRISHPVGIEPDLVNVPAAAKPVFLPREISTGEYGHQPTD